MRFDDMIDTVLSQPLNGGSIRVTVYRQLVDLIAQGRAEHDEALARRAFAAIDALRPDVPREVRAAMATALSGFRVPAGLVAHFGQEQIKDVARFLSAAVLGEHDWLDILPDLSSQARSLLRSRRDLPGRVRAALEFFGPSDLVLAPPEEPELPWSELYGDGGQSAPASAERAAVRKEAPTTEAPAPEEVAPPSVISSPFVQPAREAARRRVDHLFAAGPAPVSPDKPAAPAEHVEAAAPAESSRDPALIAGETQVRELLRRIEEFRARVPRGAGVQEAAAADAGDDQPPFTKQDHITEAVPEPTVSADAMRSRDAAPETSPSPAPASVPAPAPAPALVPAGQDFRWETDVAGTIVWVEGVAREAVIGRSVALSEPDAIEGVDMRVATAFARRAPFRDGRLRLPGSGSASGQWLIAGVPFFDPRGGKFGGFRGTAKRMQEPAIAAVPSEARVERRVQPKQPPSPDAMRQMAHELRTPLNAIVGFAEMIDRQMLGPAAQGYRDRAQDILGDAHRLLAAIDDMDAAARGAGGTLDGPPLVDPGGLVERVIGRYRGLSRERGIELIGSIAIGLPAIETSEEVLERVVGRLFAAVIGAAQAGDRLTYGVGTGERDSVRIFLSRPASLAGRDAETLYDPASAGFAAGLEAPALGLGFGLRLVRQLTSALGGQFEIEAGLFILTLPCSRAQPNTAGNVA